jgi:RNA ligase
MDGFLAILYRDTDGRLAIATRGSLASPHAIHATALFRERYEAFFDSFMDPGLTYLFEGISSKFRIVLDYGKTDDLFLLGAVDISSGRTHGPNAPACGAWNGPRTAQFYCESLSSALAMPPRKNAEGIVIHFEESDLRVKVKQEDYVQLHRLIAGMNARVVWERLGAGQTADDVCEGIPEEFWPWVRKIADELETECARVVQGAEEAFSDIGNWMLATGEATRKAFAEAANKSAYRPWLFMLLDDRNPAEAIWKTLKPSAERSLVAISEDTA